MSLVLDQGTLPKGLMIKTHPDIGSLGQTVFLGEYEISLADFMEAAAYVLTNTDLLVGKEDPRIDFVQRVKWISVAPGYMPARPESRRLIWRRP